MLGRSPGSILRFRYEFETVGDERHLIEFPFLISEYEAMSIADHEYPFRGTDYSKVLPSRLEYIVSSSADGSFVTVGDRSLTLCP
ncbi:MAG: hypothetical protein HKM89_11025 [Gemmatimonadales bacterium]|nr:hypothetical protein [Gemmatimonadales bacterium]